jgi:putative ABC transport system permease protein
MNAFTLPLRNLLARPTRSLLTTFGIAIAIAGLVALTGLTQGVRESIRSGIAEPGTDLIVAQQGVFALSSASMQQGLGSALAVAGVDGVAPVLYSVTTVDNDINLLLAGWPSDSFLWRSVHYIAGHAPGPDAAHSIVLGEAVATALGKSIGDIVELNAEDYRIVGIAHFASVLNQNTGLVPLAALQEALGRPGGVSLFQVRLARPLDDEHMAATRARLAAAAPGFAIRETEEFVGDLRLFNIISAIAGTVSLIVLAMAVVGVMNTLLMAVSERTGEIGVLSAIGWSASRIHLMLVMEALVMAAIGAAVGVGLGVAVMDLSARSTIAAGYLQTYLTAAIVLQALGAALAIGAVGALYPAWRALRLSPAEAMRRI